MARVAAPDELEQLRQLCRTGQLFEVQEWVRQGKPVALSTVPPPRYYRHGPMRIAMDRGFHSLVKVLLEAGTPMAEYNYHALEHAIQLRRPDLASLLLQYGARVEDASMHSVIEFWHPDVLELFLSRGASLTYRNPIAWGLINHMRPALGLLKRFLPEQPELQEQADIALRHHTSEGSPKWVALLLWAGADPWTRGPEEVPDWDDFERVTAEQERVSQGDDEDEETAGPIHHTAVEHAVWRGHLHILQQKGFLSPPDPSRPESMVLFDHIWCPKDSVMLSLLLEKGHLPRRLPDKGNRLVDLVLHSMVEDPFDLRRSDSLHLRGVDTWYSKDRLKMFQMLVEQGSKWVPGGTRDIGGTRKSLLRLAPKYILEVVRLFLEHQAARRGDVQELLRTASMKQVIGKAAKRIAVMVDQLPEELPSDDTPPHLRASSGSGPAPGTST